jgi:hypothetical protein
MTSKIDKSFVKKMIFICISIPLVIGIFFIIKWSNPKEYIGAGIMLGFFLPVSMIASGFSAALTGLLLKRLHARRPEFFSSSNGMNLFVGVFFSLLLLPIAFFLVQRPFTKLMMIQADHHLQEIKAKYPQSFSSHTSASPSGNSDTLKVAIPSKSYAFKNGDELKKVQFVSHQEFNGLTKDQILSKRNEEIVKLAEILEVTDYVANSDVFSQIQSDKPWWGLHGLMYYGPGPLSTTGPSIRSGSILNPLILIWPSFFETALVSANAWKEPKLNSPEVLALKLYPEVSDIVLDASHHRIEVTYQVSHFKTYLESYLKGKLPEIPLDFEGVNARDLGYPYVLLEPHGSKGIFKTVPSGAPFTESNAFYHVGNSCGFNGGCNNLSPKIPALSDWSLHTLPAQAAFKLWKSEPANITMDADVEVLLKFL